MGIKEWLPIPLADLERIGLAVSAGSQVVDPPLGEARRGFDSVCGVAHPSERESRSDFMDAIEETIQQLSGLSQVYFSATHHRHSS